MAEKRNYGQELASLSPGDVAGQMEITQEFIHSVMTAKVDYGEIPGIPTPTLLKGGAEKLIALYNGVRQTEIVNYSVDWDRETTVSQKNWKTQQMENKTVTGFVSYEIKCLILDAKTGLVLGSGLGAANSFEKKFASQGGGYATQNTVLKMAEKRAMVDAALTMSRSSGMFTQDVEDMDLDKGESSYTSKPRTEGSYNTPSSSLPPVSADDEDWITDFGAPDFKGKPISTLPPASIKFYYGAVKKNVAENKNVARNREVLKIIEKVASNQGVKL